MTTTPNLGLSYIVSSQAQKEVTHNEALNDLDSLAQLTVIDYMLSAPPASPACGDTYIVGDGATGVWSGHEGCLAAYYAGWRFKTPKTGWIAWARNENRALYYNGSIWAYIASPYLGAAINWNPGVLSQGSGSISGDISVVGAELGDYAHVAAPYDLQGAMATAYVKASNTVIVRLQNQTGDSLSFGSGLWRVRVVKA